IKYKMETSTLEITITVYVITYIYTIVLFCIKLYRSKSCLTMDKEFLNDQLKNVLHDKTTHDKEITVGLDEINDKVKRAYFLFMKTKKLEKIIENLNVKEEHRDGLGERLKNIKSEYQTSGKVLGQIFTRYILNIDRKRRTAEENSRKELNY
ncbi:hypothetical protein MHBO_000184, partial [Bonamia ostreae]